jgi:CBS-domain-containing membrane protein
MHKLYTPLRAAPLVEGAAFARPRQTLPERVRLDSPALNAMTDLRQVSAVTVWAKTSMDQANAKMIRHGVRLLLVLDDQERVAGLLTASDILGEKPFHYLLRMGGTHADIQVGDIMTELRDLETLDLDEVRGAQVGQVVATLGKSGRHHALVAEDAGRTLRGLFSITQIARQLGVPLRTFDIPQLFAAIEALAAEASP